MTKVARIERQIEELSGTEFAELREWVLERDWNRWDSQIERDVAGGKLDRLIEESQEDHRAGRSREL
jgi:hypothetical protein